MDCGRGGVGVVLDVGVEGAGWGDGEYVAYLSMIIERVAVDMVRRLVSWEQEDGTGFGRGRVCLR